MNTTTIKLSIDCDYLVYLDQELNVTGYELTPDERQALSLRYNAVEESTATMPLKTVYILEVFGINTTMVWMVENKERKGQLLFYKPSILSFSKEIAKTLDEALPISDFVSTPPEKSKEALQLPALIGGGKVDNIELEKVIKRLPFTGWMEFFWSTPSWMLIWRARPDLQHHMLSFANVKAKEAQAKIDAETETLLAEGKL